VFAAVFAILVALLATARGATASHTPPLACPNGFGWGHQCWTKPEGQEFANWLRARGVSPRGWARRHPQLATVFPSTWPGPSWDRIDRDLHSAIRYFAAAQHVSYQWLHACIHSEGGHGPTSYPVGAAGEHGPSQFLPGTFSSFAPSAWADYRREGIHVPARFRGWDSDTGQVAVHAWAFAHGLSWHWYGTGC